MDKASQYYYKNSRVIFFLFFILWVQLYPDVLFNYPYLKYTFKYPFMAIILVLLLYYGFEKSLFFLKDLFLLFLLLLLYTFYSYDMLFEMGYLWIVMLLFAGFFYKYPNYINIFIKGYLYVTIILSIHAYMVYFAYSLNISLPLEHNIEGLTSILDSGFNPFIGVVPPSDITYRMTSYFTEANRFAYFLTPAFFMLLYDRKIKYRIYLLFLIGSCIILTFSLFTAVAIILTMLLFRPNRLLLYFLLVIVIIVSCLFLKFGFYNYIESKSLSFATRIASFYNACIVFHEHPFGMPSGSTLDDYMGIEYGSLYTVPLFYLVYTGIQGLIVSSLFVMLLSTKISYVIKHGSAFQKNFAMGIFAYLLCQLFLGLLFEFLFSAFIGILLAWHRDIKKSSGSNGNFSITHGSKTFARA